MPIINMAQSREEAEGRGVNVHPYKTQVTKRDEAGNYLDGQSEDHIIWTYETHVGLCLEDRERNGYDDSDWYMTVWNEEKQATEEICFATTRGWSYPCYGSSPDATPEVCAAANEYRRRLAINGAILHDQREARTPKAGRRVQVVRGRKVPLGEYWIHHVMADQYRERHNSPAAVAWGIASKPLRLALQPVKADGSVDRASAFMWTADTNCEVLNPEQYERPVAEIAARFEREVWYAPRVKEVAA
jgi:hypothetical protein